jgi:hypothetical protein
MKIVRCALGALVMAGLAAWLTPAFAATHYRAPYRPYPHAPARITIYPAHPARIDFSRYIDPISGMYCRNTGWAAECVPPPVYTRGIDCAPAWPFAVCRAF